MANITIKQILTSDQNWWRFFEKHKNRIRAAIVICIIKLLSCKNTIRGYQTYACSNPDCSHTKRVPFTCKSRACSSCGKKATELWLQKQKNTLPQTAWQHITFTMPSELWDFFWCNRSLLNQLSGIAAQCIQKIARKKKITPGIFTALHTFGRSLKRNVHVHLSTTTNGISFDGASWKKLFFHQSTLMKMWRYEIIQLLRQAYQNKTLTIPPAIQAQLNHSFTFLNFLNSLYMKHWVVHCAKPSDNYKRNIEYFVRYTKRPPIALSKLKHYDGNSVTFKYLDHASKRYQTKTLNVEQFIAKFIQHIPDTGFRLIRYYGFLANRVRGKLLPKVYQLINQKSQQKPNPPSYAQLIFKNFNFNPLECILCGAPLVLIKTLFGKSNPQQLLPFHRQLATLKNL